MEKNIKDFYKYLDRINYEDLFKLIICNIYLKLGYHDKELLDYCYHINDKNEFIINDISKEIEEINNYKTFLFSLFDSLGKKRYFKESLSNKATSTLAIKLLDLKNNDIVIDLGSGQGIFCAYLYKYCLENNIQLSKIIGEEISKDSYLLSKIMFSIFDDSKTLFFNEDIVNNKHKFNKAYCFSPIGNKINTRYESSLNIILNIKNSLSLVFIDKVLTDSLDKAIIITSPSILFNSFDRKYINELILEGYLEGIIELPKGFLIESSLKLCMLVISRNNKFVKLLSLDNTENVIEEYENASKKNINEIIDYDNLIPSNLFLKDQKIKSNITLKDIAEIFNGSQYTISNFAKKLTDNKTEYSILSSSDIEDEKINIDGLRYINNNDKKLDKYLLKQNDIIITSKSSKMKIAIIDFQPQNKIIATGGIIIIRPDINKLNPTFFKIFFNSKIGYSMIKSLQKGTVISILKADELKDLSFPNIDINKQNSIANEYNINFNLINEYKNKIEIIKNELDNYCNDIFE